MRRLLLAGAAMAALALPATAPAFVTNDPLAPRQWYLGQDRAFDAWSQPPLLTSVRVAVVDSGIDGSHPEFAGRIVAWKSFVGGSALVDTAGHGTFVAGEIAAATDNGHGIAGMAPGARLVVAKVVRPDGTVEPYVEAEAIRWAVDQGARVVNLSLGATRDPLEPTYDFFSPLEQSAVAYAVAKGAVVVASVGNADGNTVPWPFADYPAAFPHVIGVSAYGPDGSVPEFSNRDSLYNDIAAPGERILSTFPRKLTAKSPTCRDQGYSSCAPPPYRHGDGTSFAAPQVSAAAAMLLSIRPRLTPDQVAYLLERSADDATPDNGCDSCRVGRDQQTGWGRLDVEAAVKTLKSGGLPTPDRLEPNDDAGASAAPLAQGRRGLTATLDFWDDPVDVYRVRLRRGRRVTVSVRGRDGLALSLTLWKPGTEHVDGAASLQAAHSASPASGTARISYRASKRGWYYVEVTLGGPGAGVYALRLSKGY
ncbi:MAG: S8 family serine peptidase [Gaiellaceae bacterium]